MKKEHSQKDGLLWRPASPERERIEEMVLAFGDEGVTDAFVAAMGRKLEKRDEVHRRAMTKVRGLTVGTAMLTAIDDAPFLTLVPYVTKRDYKVTTVLRLHAIDLETGEALPESNVKVADCDLQMNLSQKGLTEDFLPGHFKLLREAYIELTELGLYKEPARDAS